MTGIPASDPVTLRTLRRGPTAPDSIALMLNARLHHERDTQTILVPIPWDTAEAIVGFMAELAVERGGLV
jgi:hypothetical protein